MRLLFLLLLAAPVWADSFGLTPIVTLEEIPDDSEYFLQGPQVMDVDARGNYYVADAQSKVVFMWNAKGAYLGTMGKPGQGPGEFTFMGNGGPEAYLSTLGNQIFVLDGARKNLSIFDTDRKFVKAVPLRFPGGRTAAFSVTKDGNFLVYQQSWGKEPPTREVIVLDQNGELINEIKVMEDDTFSRRSEGGQFRGITIKGFSPNLTMGYNALNDQVTVGFTGSPSFEVFDVKGNLLKSVKVKMVQRDITREDKDEFNEMPWIKNNNFFNAEFPDKRAYYDMILPLKDDRYLLCELSPFYRNVTGLLVDGKGQTLARINHKCGEAGVLRAVKGRLLAIQTDEDGDYVLQEMEIKL